MSKDIMEYETKLMHCTDCKPYVPCAIIVNKDAEAPYCPISGGRCNWVEDSVQDSKGEVNGKE